MASKLVKQALVDGIEERHLRGQGAAAGAARGAAGGRRMRGPF